ncbi:T9SS type A sorting domain-containing protein [Bacteroidota bacterium]
MKLLLTNTLLILTLSASAQVTNEIVLYAKPGTDVKVVGDFANSASGTFTVDANAALHVDGDLNNNGLITFENNASLMRISTSADGGSGTYRVKRQGTTGQKFNLWSSPVVASGTTPGSISYSFDETVATQSDQDDAPADIGWNIHSGNMTPGEGYGGLGAGLVTFSDNAVNNGTITSGLHVATYDASHTSVTGGTPFNLVGNPYPSAIDAWKLVNDPSNANIHGSIYFWDDDGSGGTGYSYNDYSIWNASGGLPAVTSGGGGSNVPNGIIPTAQGFMVRNETATQLTFKNAMRVVNNSSNRFFKTNGSNNRLWLSINGTAAFNQILVNLNEDATEGEDRLYDAVKVQGNKDLSLSAHSNGNNYAIIAFPPPFIDKTLPLSLFVSADGSYSFKADIMEGFKGYDVYLQDVVKGTNQLVTEGKAIEVALKAGKHADRFYLNFARTATPTGIANAEENNLVAYAANDFLHVGCTTCASNATITLLDMSGRMVLTANNPQFNGGNASIALNGLSTGVYVVRVTTDKQTLSQKIIKH